MTDISRLNDVLAGRYVIERELGHGGMATVYLARDERHQRMVAVKVLRPDLAVALGGERFLREIRIAATLQHPNILTLIDSGVVGDVLYYVMPFADGQSLRDRLAGGPLPVSDAVRYLHDVFDALAHAHTQGIVHRDVKPDNIMISGRHALVVDFGIAKAMSAARLEAVGAGDEALTQVGASIGTPAYMAPEQAAGDPDVNHSADIYAAGVVAYEMLSGSPPFIGPAQQVLAAQIHKEPAPLATVAPATPAALARLVMRCLEKEPANRFSSADDALLQLESLATPEPRVSSAKGDVRLSRRTAIAMGTAAVLLLGAVGFAGYRKVSDERWARSVAVPEITRLIEGNVFDSAFALATRAERILGDDASLAALWPRTSAKVAFVSEPAGARVFRTSYNDSLGWTLLGVTPTDSIRVPLGPSRYRYELAGYHPVHRATGPGGARGRVVLQHMDSTDGRMVRVPRGQAEVAMPGLSRLPILPTPEFLIDKYEVTNAEYKRFVDAGGYEKSEYWEHAFVEGGHTLPRAEAMRRFVDRTGRPGPATWEAGDFPAGQGDIPVTGISWYEGAAYAKFVGKSLPTLYHWNRAASTTQGALMIPGSNYGGQGPVRGSTFRGMSIFGAFDMAGNVREWVFNATGDKRFILGGGWSDGAYSFSDAYAQPPMNRSPLNGMRLVKATTPDGLGSPQLAAAVAQEYRDYTKERPAGDVAFRGYRSFYEYDRSPLNARLDYRDTTSEHWVRERVSFDAAYGGERTGVVMFIPKHRRPPFQAVVVMGGSNLLYTTSDSAINPRFLDYLVKSGRMVVWPIYKGMFDRGVGLTTDSPQETSAYRDLVVAMVKDNGRAVDYLVTRADVDSSKLAFFGASFGGRVSPPLLAMEPRFKAAMLNVTGLKMERARSEVDPINFLPRIRLPLLMLNGRYDFYFPVETSQKPFFEYLGTPAEHKKWVIYPEAHTVPRTELMRETLAWLDKYLGSVR
ncbi:MAG TPA: protein kinase [Gemmatimonadaceae bacterium]|nr:protein kinase [Gemmatimonadaceae bacterium]